ncbi:MAG: hypothetical protein ABFS32_06330 [Bacteroidota bacterium]
MRRVLVIAIGLIITQSLSYAQDGPQPIVDNEMKVQFTPPEGWQATKKDIGYVMGSDHTEGFMLLKVQDFKSIKKLKAAMEAGVEQEDGSILKPTGDLTLLGDQGVSGMYSGTIDETEMTGFLMALLPPSKRMAVICISVAPQSNFNQSNIDQLKMLLRSVIFL